MADPLWTTPPERIERANVTQHTQEKHTLVARRARSENRLPRLLAGFAE
jgi:hypothetical protein